MKCLSVAANHLIEGREVNLSSHTFMSPRFVDGCCPSHLQACPRETVRRVSQLLLTNVIDYLASCAQQHNAAVCNLRRHDSSHDGKRTAPVIGYAVLLPPQQ